MFKRVDWYRAQAEAFGDNCTWVVTDAKLDTDEPWSDALDDQAAAFARIAAHFGLLALALEHHGYACVCDGCGVEYVRQRPPARGRRNYCQSCGLTAAWRDAQRRRRSKRPKVMPDA